MIKLATLFLLLASFAPTQTRERIPPPDFVREVVVDDAGLQQWAPYEVKCEPCQGLGTSECLGCKGATEIIPNCTECDGEHRAPCRTCAGKKILPDPLIEMACPFCRGSAWFNCGQCGGPGMYYTTDQTGARTELVCRACDKKGRYKCNVCTGTRRIETVRMKKKHPGEAKGKDLVQMREDVNKCLEAFTAYEPLDRGAKSFDLFEETAKPFMKKIPQLKDAVDLLEITIKGLRKVGAGYEGYEAKNTFQVLLMKDRTIYMLQHNLRALDQAIERDKHNAPLEADK